MAVIQDCKTLTRLISESFERPLTMYERMGMFMHLIICIGCRRFRQQQKILHLACKQLPEHGCNDL